MALIYGTGFTSIHSYFLWSMKLPLVGGGSVYMWLDEISSLAPGSTEDTAVFTPFNGEQVEVDYPYDKLMAKYIAWKLTRCGN